MTEPVCERNGRNPEEEILKESKETDWTEDTIEHADPEDFDVCDLECVDEENEDKRNDDRRRIKEAKQDECRSKRRMEDRYNPYKIPHDHMNSRDSSKKKINKHSPARIARDRKRRKEYYEKKKALRNEGGIDLDELEEIDSCEFGDDTPNDSLSTPCPSESSASSPAPDNDEDDPWTKSISGADPFPLMDDEDFPSLCEEIDPDILKKASQAQNTTEPTSVSPPAKENDKDEKLEEYSGPSKQRNGHHSPAKRNRSSIIRRNHSPARRNRSPRRRSRSIDTSPWRTWNERKDARRRESGSRDRADRRRHHPATDRKTTSTEKKLTRHERPTENGRRGEEQASNKDQPRETDTRRPTGRSTSPREKARRNRQDSHPRPPTSRQIRDYIIELDSRNRRKPEEHERRRTSDPKPRSDHQRLPVRRA